MVMVRYMYQHKEGSATERFLGMELLRAAYENIPVVYISDKDSKKKELSQVPMAPSHRSCFVPWSRAFTTRWQFYRPLQTDGLGSTALVDF